MGRAVKVQGIECPIIREGDNIVDIVVDRVLNVADEDMCGISFYNINNKDIIGITESVVARAAGQYVTVDDIARDVCDKFQCDPLKICLTNPIYSRNRFSMILKGIARAADKSTIVMPEYDEVGNPRGVNPFTGVNIEEYYKELCEKEGCKCEIVPSIFPIDENMKAINCSLRPSADDDCYYFGNFEKVYTLRDICSNISPDWGVLGTNKATAEKLKLFPSKAECQRICEGVKAKIKEVTGKDVIVCVYGDGCFKDPVGGIWEFADPVTMPYYTDKELMESSPNELKVKALIDSQEPHLYPGHDNDDRAIKEAIKINHSGVIKGDSQMGTTPRIYRDLIASLMDLTSGSGDRCTPVVLVQNYF